LNQAYLRKDTFDNDLMRLFHMAKKIREKNCQLPGEFLDLMIRIYDIAEGAGMLTILLHQNNLSLCMRTGLMGSRPGGAITP
jgi:hypothetical protein